jgi:hypothetical protein
MNKDEMKNKISMALKDPILQQGFEIICKNLAELEKVNTALRQDWDVMKSTITDYEKENAELKELLKQWLQTSKASGCDNINIVTDTEQFISEVEK